MRNNWSVNFAIIYLLLIFVINFGFSIWSAIEYSRLTDNINKLDQAETISQGFESLVDSIQSILPDNNADSRPEDVVANEIQIKAEQLANRAKSVFIYLFLSSFASIFTTIALMFPKLVMETIEKFVELPHTDFDSIEKFRFVMVLANISILFWDIYGAIDIIKYILNHI